MTVVWRSIRVTGLHGPPLVVVLPVERWQRWWSAIEDACRAADVPIDLLLAVVAVESALPPRTVWDALRVFSPGAEEAITQETGQPLPQDTVAALHLAALYLARLRQRYAELAAVLVALHTDPGRVHPVDPQALLDPHARDYVKAVRATRRWLCRIRPWQAWETNADALAASASGGVS